jgi:hypothetical protein
MEANIIHLRLGREELALMLRILRTPTLPGLGTDPLEGLTEEQADLALTAAERSLRARGILQVAEGEKRVQVDPVTFALIGTCILPKTSLMMSCQTMDGKTTIRYYHIGEHLTVEHSFPEIGVSSFWGTAQWRPMLPRMLDLLQLDRKESLLCPPVSLLNDQLDLAKDLAIKQNLLALQELLRKSGAASDSAELLAQTLVRARRSCAMVKIDYSNRGTATPASSVAGFATIEGSGSLWLLTPETTNTGQPATRLELASGDQVKERLKELVGTS